jgi:hypothetical protein
VTPELRALGLSLDVLALRVDRGDTVPPSDLEAAAEAVEVVGPKLTDEERLWLHGRVERMLEAMQARQGDRRAQLARLQQGRRAMRGYGGER